LELGKKSQENGVGQEQGRIPVPQGLSLGRNKGDVRVHQARAREVNGPGWVRREKFLPLHESPPEVHLTPRVTTDTP
jgi:hypothetical protein